MRIEHPAKLATQGSPLENILEGVRLCTEHRADSRHPAVALVW